LALSLPASRLLADDLKDGRAALQAGRLDDAVSAFEKAASQGYAEGRAGVGQVRLKQLRYSEAMEAFKLAQKMDPNLALPYYGQGEVLRRQGKCGEAIPLLQKAVELDRKFPEATLSLGGCLVESHKIDEAIQVLSQGLKWGPKWRPKFLVAVGDAELSRDSLRAAASYYTRAREESPEDPVTHRALGMFYVKRGTFELAVPELQAAADLDTSDVELKFALGQALFYARRYNDALDVYRSVVARAPEFPPGQLALGDLYYRSGAADRRRYADAREPLEKYVAMMPQDPKGLSVLGRTYYQLGLKDEALQTMNKAEQLGDKTKELFTLRARLHVERKEWDDALKDYALGEPAPEDMLRLAQVHAIKGNTASAESLYAAMIGQDSTSSTGRFALNELGKLRYKQKNYPEAATLFQRRIALDPNNDEAYYYLGLSFKELKQYPEALAALLQAATLAPGKFDRVFWLAMMYAEMDSVPQARQWLTRAVDLDSAGVNRNTGFALRQLGYYELLGKKNEEAIRLLERAVAINPNDTQAWVWLAQGYHNSGNKSRACEAYDRVLALDPNQAVALKGKKTLGCSQSQQGGSP
jgi:tetratricopeptide (TPR) repeat protein